MMERLSVYEMIPEYLFQDSSLLKLYVFGLREARNKNDIGSTNSLVAVKLKPYQTSFDYENLKNKLAMDDVVISRALNKLKEFDLVDFERLENLILIRYKKITLPRECEVSNKNQDSDTTPIISFHEFGIKYLKWVDENLAPKTLENAQRVISHFNKMFTEISVHELKSLHLEEFKEARKKVVSLTTVNMDIRTLKATLEMAIDWGYIKENPFRRIKTIRQENKRTDYLDKDEFERLLFLVEEPFLKLIFKFAVLTGMRRGEIINLQWKDVDFALKSITIQSSEYYRVKHGKTRTIPINDEIVQLLHSIKERFDPFVFTLSTGEKIQEDFVTKKFKSYWRMMVGDDDQRKIRFHSLRATFATWMAGEKVQPHIIKEFLGHTYLKTTEAYTRVPTEIMQAAIKKLSTNKNFPISL